MALEARKLIDEVEEMGGMTAAVIAGMPKQRIEEAATRKQARLDRGEDAIVGVNKFRSDTKDEVDILEVDNTEVRESQVARLKKVRVSRDENACRAALDTLTSAAAGDENLLALSVDASRARATVGEISDALEKEFTRYRAQIRSISGVYGSAYEGDKGFKKIRGDVAEFAKKEGRRPRMFVVKLGQDGHDRGAKVIARSLRDAGMEVIYTGLRQTPEQIVDAALQEDADAIGVSILSGAHNHICPRIMELLKARGLDDVLVVVGGIIPDIDIPKLQAVGIDGVFQPGTPMQTIVDYISVHARRDRDGAAPLA